MNSFHLCSAQETALLGFLGVAQCAKDFHGQEGEQSECDPLPERTALLQHDVGGVRPRLHDVLRPAAHQPQQVLHVAADTLLDARAERLALRGHVLLHVRPVDVLGRLPGDGPHQGQAEYSNDVLPSLHPPDAGRRCSRPLYYVAISLLRRRTHVVQAGNPGSALCGYLVGHTALRAELRLPVQHSK